MFPKVRRAMLHALEQRWHRLELEGRVRPVLDGETYAVRILGLRDDWSGQSILLDDELLVRRRILKKADVYRAAAEVDGAITVLGEACRRSRPSNQYVV